MGDNFSKIRFALFTKSYAGYCLSLEIRESKNPNLLIEKLAEVLLFDRRSVRCFILHKSCKGEFSKIIKTCPMGKAKISIYLQIEKELITLIQHRTDKNSLISEDYEYALLEPAIERVAGNALAKVNNDGEFETKLITLIRFYRHFYYDVSRTYGLPTLRIVPFILRLIIL